MQTINPGITKTGASNFPLHMPNDPEIWTRTVNITVAAGYYPKRPTLNELAVEAVTHNPSTGEVRVHGRRSRRTGISHFLNQVHKQAPPRARMPKVQGPTFSFDLDDDPQASTTPIQHTNANTGLPDTVGAAGPHDRWAFLAKEGVQRAPDFDINLSRLGSEMADALHDLVHQGLIRAQLINGEVWVCQSEADHFTAAGCDL